MRTPRTSRPSAGDDAHRKKLGEAAARDRRTARQRLGRSEKRLPEMGGATSDPDLRQVGAKASALTLDDVTRLARELVVERTAAFRVSRSCRCGGAAQRAHVGDQLLQFVVGQPPDARHPSVRNAVANHVAKGLVAAGPRQRGTIQRRALVARAIDAVTPCAHAVEELFPLRDVGAAF